MGDTTNVQLEAVNAHVTTALLDLENLFVEGMQLAFVAIHPNNPDAHMIVSATDDPRDIIKAVEETLASRHCDTGGPND